MLLTEDEYSFIARYRERPRLEQLAIRASLMYDDSRLLNFLRERGKCLDCPPALLAPECKNEFALLVGEINFD